MKNNKIRILHFIKTLDPSYGGIYYCLKYLSDYLLSSQSIQTNIIAFDKNADKKFFNKNIEIHSVGPVKTSYSYSPFLKKRLTEHIQNNDIIIIHGLWQYINYLITILRRKKLNKVFPKTYIMSHGMLDPYFQKAKGRRLKAIRNYIFWSLIENKAINEADGILFTSKDELLLARQTFSGYKPKKEINMGYGIQNPPLNSSDHNRKIKELFAKLKIEDQKFWLFLSRIHPKKGLDLLIQSYLKAYRFNNSIPALIIAGPGIDTAYGRKMVKLSKGYPIYFLGMLQGAEKWGAFYNSEAFLLPSHQENFGIAVVEAMACKKPVLISNKVNIWREIDQNKAGIICEDNQASINDAIEKLSLMPPQELKDMGERAYETYKLNFTIEKAAKNLLQALTS